MRRFFGMEVAAPWPEEFPNGRLLLEADRHLTLAFLGDEEPPDLASFPKPAFEIGPAGIFDKPLFLPHREPRVAAWHIHWLEEGVATYQKQLAHWLQLKEEKFLSHVTIARKPFVIHEWKEPFQKLPMYVKDICFYESLGCSHYKALWKYPLLAPFDEIEHTADIAFRVRGDLYLHAQLALAFKYPPLIGYFHFQEMIDLEEIVSSLNVMIARADSEIGCPFKAVSFHGALTANNEWEMIVDV